MRRIRVLQITHDLNPGGLPRVVETLCRTLDPEQFAVSVLCLLDAGPLARGLSVDLGIPVHVLHDRPDTVDRAAFLKVSRFLKASPVDVIHTHNTGPFFDGTLGAALAGVRTVVHTEHGRDWSDNPLRWRVVENLLSFYAHRVVGVSDEITTALHSDQWIDTGKLLTIPNGVEGARYDVSVDRREKRRQLGLDPDGLVIGYASRLESEKNCSLLVRVFADLASQVPAIQLAIAGYGSEEAHLRSLAAELGIAERVHFLGVRSDIPEVLNTYDIHVLPSLREGLPMILLETMAAGCPTVATAVGGVPEVLQHGLCGRLVPPGDHTAMTRAILELVMNPELRQRFARRAKARFWKTYDAWRMTERYQALYRREG